LYSEKVEKGLRPGVVTGLAWTAFGGEILTIETLPLRGKGEFKITGQLGEVMNESASLAYSYVKSLLQKEIEESFAKVKIKKVDKDKKEKAEAPEDFLASHEIHLHLPAGATPKDGPSAGITMALALYGLARNKRVKSSIAMTGELSLTGKVLPVGGIKEKVLGAKRAGIKEIILPKRNEKDLLEVPARHRKGIKFYPVERFDEVLKIAIKN
jgi:ATP-dependent Lon protease